MAVDRPLALATPTQMLRSPLRHLVSDLAEDELDDILMRATRACEAECGGRRLAPFEGLVEVHRADGVPSDGANWVGPGYGVGAVAAAGYASAVTGASGGMVRSVWLDQTPALFPEMWQYRDVTIEVFDLGNPGRPVAVGTVLGGGPTPDTGELRFSAGTYVPVGAQVRVRYSGGYDPVPQNLVQACRLMAAADIGGEDDNYPGGDGLTTHLTAADPSSYLGRALKLLKPYGAG